MLLIFGIELIVLVFLRKILVFSFARLLHQFGLSSLMTIWTYSLITLPGLIVHEIAHFMMALVLGLRTGSIVLLPNFLDDGSVELGSVQVEKKDPIRLSIVGFAPLLFGYSILLLISLNFLNLSFDQIVQSIGSFISLFSRNWFWIYISLSICLHIFPSKQDMKSWPIASLLLLVIYSLVYVLGIKFVPNEQFVSKLILAQNGINGLMTMINFLILIIIIVLRALNLLTVSLKTQYRSR